MAWSQPYRGIQYLRREEEHPAALLPWQVTVIESPNGRWAEWHIANWRNRPFSYRYAEGLCATVAEAQEQAEEAARRLIPGFGG